MSKGAPPNPKTTVPGAIPPPQPARPKLWGGRFAAATATRVETYTQSVGFDRRLYPYDIAGSIAHARMLAHVGVLSSEDCSRIVHGLEDILIDIERGDFAWSAALEDVHMNIEARLTERIGDAGKRLHTARSRNDQVATDLRLYLRAEVDGILHQLRRLMHALVTRAEAEAGTVMPGYTHMQVAQPITFGHHLLAWFEMWARDHERLLECRARVNRSPLGAAALAGTSYPIDRAYSAELLDFEAVCANSLDAVSDRDFAIEFASCAALMMMHSSRMAEELILWANPAFGFIELPDAYCTGSSIMPQKKNPDIAVLARGKTARVYGHLMALLTLMKAQPLAYNRDNQEDKEALFDSVDTLKATVSILADLIPALEPQRARMLQAARQGYSTATDLADYLVRKGVAFRDAHEVVGRAVRYGIEQQRDLAELTLEELQGFSPAIGAEVYTVLTLEGSVAARTPIGGTAPDTVRAACTSAYARITAFATRHRGMRGYRDEIA